MANIKSFPNNQNVYIGAEDVMKWLHGRTSGVFAADNNAAVNAVQNEMAVTVSDGLGWLANSGKDGVVWWVDHEAINGDKLKLSVDAADSALNRIDRIIVEWKTTNYVDYPEVKVLKGAIASNPSAPALTNNSTVRQISLAKISVAAGTTAITASMITDERLDTSVCGLVTESITIDTSTMQNQFEALLKSIQNELQDLNDGTASLLKAGGTMYGALDMGGNKIQNVATPENEGDAVNKKFVEDAFANFESGLSMELLWENERTTSSFEAGNIPNLPFDLYDEYCLMAMVSAQYQYVLFSKAPCGKNIAFSFDWADDGVYHSRVFKSNGNSLDVMQGWKSKAKDSNSIIPYRIYGIKGVS